MRVNAEGDRDMSVSEPFLHDPRVDIRLECEGCPRMPQTVGRDPRKVPSLDPTVEFAGYAFRVKRVARGLGEDEPVVPVAVCD